jgi:sporulation protein YlmC with PRC-barrel domain
LGWVANNYIQGTPLEPVANAVTSVIPSMGGGGGSADNPINDLGNAEPYVATPENGKAQAIDGRLHQDKNTGALMKVDDGIMHSLRDVVTSEVFDRKGTKTGRVHDIVIDKRTGEASAIIVNETGISYQKKLKEVSFKEVVKQAPEGEVTLSATTDELSEENEFIYTELDPNTISLRLLRSAQILDDQGKVAGEVDAVIYENAEAQAIYFTVIPTLAKAKETKPFRLPYEAVNIVKNADGYDVQLNKEQTEAVAKTLFKAPPQEENATETPSEAPNQSTEFNKHDVQKKKHSSRLNCHYFTHFCRTYGLLPIQYGLHYESPE